MINPAAGQLQYTTQVRSRYVLYAAMVQGFWDSTSRGKDSRIPPLARYDTPVTPSNSAWRGASATPLALAQDAVAGSGFPDAMDERRGTWDLAVTALG